MNRETLRAGTCLSGKKTRLPIVCRAANGYGTPAWKLVRNALRTRRDGTTTALANRDVNENSRTGFAVLCGAFLGVRRNRIILSTRCARVGQWMVRHARLVLFCVFGAFAPCAAFLTFSALLWAMRMVPGHKLRRASTLRRSFLLRVAKRFRRLLRA